MDWEQFKEALKARFEPVLDPVQTSLQFRSASQRAGESVQCYLARLRDLATKWEQTLPVFVARNQAGQLEVILVCTDDNIINKVLGEENDRVSTPFYSTMKKNK